MKYIILFSFICLSACSTLDASEKSSGIENEYYILLSSLLSLNENRHTYIDEHGRKQVDLLKSFKELEHIYIDNIEPDLPNNKFTLERLKIIMFFSFYSHERNSAAFQEYLAADLVPIYNNNKESFIITLKELPFLITSNCNRLNAYFGHEGSNEDKKPEFLSTNKQLLSKYLNSDELNLCLSNFNDMSNN